MVMMMSGVQNESVCQHHSSIPNGISLPGGATELKFDGTGSAIKDRGVFVLPKPGFVIKTQQCNAKSTGSDSKKLFINVCSSDAVSEPGQTKKLDDAGNEVEGLNVPVSVGPVRTCCDKAGRPSHAVDCIVSPNVVKEVESDKTGSYRDFICQVLIQCVEGKSKGFAPLDKKYKLPHLAYHGYVHSKTGEAVQKSSEYAEVARQLVRDCTKRPTIQEIDSPSTDAPSSPGTALPKKGFQIDISVEISNGEVMPLFTFIEEVKKLALDRIGFQVEPSLSEDKQEYFSPSQLLTQPLLYDSAPPRNFPANERLSTWTVKKLHARIEIIEKAVWGAQVKLSAFVLSVAAPGYTQTECVLPFCVFPKTAACSFSERTSQLSFMVSVADTAMDDNADVGSHPWMFAAGLLSGKRQPSTCTKAAMKSLSKNDPKDKTGSSSIDPFLLGPLGVDTSAELLVEEDTVLPEDKFHAQDVMSQHMIEQQEKERQEKKEKGKTERESAEHDGDVEYVSVDDFKPGGKYYYSENAQAREGGLSEKKKDVGSAKHLRKAEDLVRKRGPAFSNSLWSNLV